MYIFRTSWKVGPMKYLLLLIHKRTMPLWHYIMILIQCSELSRLLFLLNYFPLAENKVCEKWLLCPLLCHTLYFYFMNIVLAKKHVRIVICHLYDYLDMQFNTDQWKKNKLWLVRNPAQISATFKGIFGKIW